MNVKKLNQLILFLLVLGFIPMTNQSSVYAATQYVSDKLIITMRGGGSKEYKIIKMLKTGTPVEVLGENGQYYKVQTEDGKKGWVIKRYITADIPKPIIIAGLTRKIEKLKNSIEKLHKKRAGLEKDLKAVKSVQKGAVKEFEKSIYKQNDRIQSITKQLQGITNKYNKLVEDSGNVVNVVSERDKLNEENAKLDTEKNDLLKENESLSDRKSIFWFLAGAVVFFFGWIAGKLSRKKKGSSFLRDG